MGLYERSLKTHIRIRASNTGALRAILALADELGEQVLDGSELIVTRELYETMIRRGLYRPVPRSGSDRRQGDRRKGPRRKSPPGGEAHE